MSEREMIEIKLSVEATQANVVAIVDFMIELERELRRISAPHQPGNSSANDIAVQRRHLQEEYGLVWVPPRE